MRTLAIIMSIFMISGCKTYGDYSVGVENQQMFSSIGIKEIVIECFCSDSINIQIGTSNDIEVTSTWELSSVGYHGVQEVPSDDPSEYTMLLPEQANSVLKLRSTEYTYMHHASLITNLGVTHPKGTKVTISKINYGDLEGRKVKA